MDQFRKLGINDALLRVIEEERFEEPTEVQAKSIPLIIAGKDVIAGSATGSGKTLAFAAGIVGELKGGSGIQALVLTPTRELAEQVAGALVNFSKYKRLQVVSIYGGVSIDPQIRKLQRADVVVGTPGRILDHIDRRTIDLRKVKILVLDEADRMLDMGFRDDVEQIIEECPKDRQTLLFSATISEDVSRLAQRYMKKPSTVSAEQYVDPTKLTQVYYDVTDPVKFSLLVHLLKHEESGLVMVFCNTRRNVDFVVNNLRPNGINAIAIHGGFSQAKRSNTMNLFHSGKVCILVCTDVAARGLDIKNVSHIYNYDIPKDSKEYIHRIGRTARAGEDGKVINILAPRDHDNFTQVLRDHAIDIIQEETPYVDRVFIKWKGEPRRFGNRRPPGRFGNREPSRFGRRRPSFRD